MTSSNNQAHNALGALISNRAFRLLVEFLAHESCVDAAAAEAPKNTRAREHAGARREK